jgi:hypothetical protein
MANMRAKVRVSAVLPNQTEGVTVSERLMFSGVAKSGSYPADGSDENNTFAKFSPSVSFDMLVANPALLGKFAVGDTFYVDFSPAT